MDLISTIVIVPRKPYVPGNDPEKKPVRHSKNKRASLILIIYDTQRIEEINEHSRCRLYGLRPIYVPAKYAIVFKDGPCDSDIFCQSYAIDDADLNKAVWFNGWHDLPIAIAQLRERFPDLEISEQVDHVFDWPLRYDPNKRFDPNISIVAPVPPIVTKSDDGDD